MNDEVFKIVREGKDIATATPEECVIHSSYPFMKCKEIHVAVTPYTFVATPAVDTNLITVAHGFSYIPAALVYVDVPASLTPSGNDAQYILPFFFTVGTGDFINAYTDNVNLYINYTKGAVAPALAGVTLSFKYFIFVDDGL